MKYAAWKAADIRKALREGRVPAPGAPGEGMDDLQMLGDDPFGEGAAASGGGSAAASAAPPGGAAAAPAAGGMSLGGPTRFNANDIGNAATATSPPSAQATSPAASAPAASSAGGLPRRDGDGGGGNGSGARMVSVSCCNICGRIDELPTLGSLIESVLLYLCSIHSPSILVLLRPIRLRPIASSLTRLRSPRLISLPPESPLPPPTPSTDHSPGASPRAQARIARLPRPRHRARRHPRAPLPQGMAAVLTQSTRATSEAEMEGTAQAATKGAALALSTTAGIR